MLQLHGLRPADAQKRTPAKTVIEETIIMIIIIIKIINDFIPPVKIHNKRYRE